MASLRGGVTDYASAGSAEQDEGLVPRRKRG